MKQDIEKLPVGMEKMMTNTGFLGAIDDIGQNIEQKIINKEEQKKTGNGQKVMLIIRDGWGNGPENEKNAIANAQTPFHDYLVKNFPTAMLKTDSESVGLPSGTMGNSEVGHSTIGMGRVLYQPLVRINNSIQNGEFFENETLKKAANFLKNTNGDIHIAGVLQTEGVHGHIDHIVATVEFFAKNNPEQKINIHVFTDGRDSVKDSGLKMLEDLKARLDKITQNYIFATISGRYYAMDRDNRWDRTEAAYAAILNYGTKSFIDPFEYIKQSYEADIYDEFVVPAQNQIYSGLKNGDAFIFTNFRTDRPRQLTKALIDPNFNSFEKQKTAPDIYFAAMTEYYAGIENGNVGIIIPNISLENSLGKVVSDSGLTQLRISETEKYPHVTFFLNGQIEEPFKGQTNKIIPSPRVATYDLQPEMSADAIASELIKEVVQNQFDLVVVNLVNADMVGHTGVYEAAVKGCEAVDQALQKIIEGTKQFEYNYLVFADHGNSEEEYGVHTTTHTLNLVWCSFLLNSELSQTLKLQTQNGNLYDIAPTALKIMGLQKPKEMTGQSLLV